jgi:regulatory protein
MSGSGNRGEESGGCFKKALDLLARRPHFQRELVAKLERRGFDELEIGETCRRLVQQGLLDELECARNLVNGRLRRQGYGPRRVRAVLMQRGARDEIIAQAVEEAFGGGEEPLLRATAEAWLRRNPWNRDKLARHLERKGFHTAAILGVLGQLDPEAKGPEGGDPE